MQVLLIDASEIIRSRLLGLLKEIGIQDISESHNVSEAITNFTEKKIRLIILNLTSDWKSEISEINKLKSIFNKADVISLSHFSNQLYKQKCLESGSDYYFDLSTEIDSAVVQIKKISEKNNFYKNIKSFFYCN